MRRISLAFALAGALAGCGGNVSPNSGNGKGTGAGTFTITVQNGQGQTRNAAGVLPTEMLGGTVTGTSINCAAATGETGCSATFAVGTSVTLTATPIAPNEFLGWAGDCQGEALTCNVTANANGSVFVVAMFGVGRTAHPNWADPSVHATNYLAQTLTCTDCHGANLLGQGMAPSCASCHGWPIGGHAVASGHNSGACARCHAGAGFRDYIGVDGTADNHEAGYAAATPTVAAALESTTIVSGIPCTTCHSDTAGALVAVPNNTILFAQASGAGKTVVVKPTTAICGQCHTGIRDDRNIAQVGKQLGTPTDWDAQLAAASNKAVRPHYLGAATTLLGAQAGAYGQVAGNVYTGGNAHGGKDSCVDCHNPHTGEIPADPAIEAKCGGCHNDELTGLPVRTFVELEESRQFGFEGDIDGDNASESVKAELDGLLAKLDNALNVYGEMVGGKKMCQRIESSGLVDQPYVLVDSAVACGTTPNNVAYNAFTARSLRAAFNFAAIKNDPGAWAHNPRYAVEIVYDAIADLNAGLVAKGFGSATVSNGKRAFNGHFGAAEDPSPYAAMIYHGSANAVTGEVLPNMGFTSDACLQCHGGKGGFAAYLGAAPAAMPAGSIANKVTAMQCDTCHVFNGADMKAIRSDVAAVYFPPQKGATPPVAQKVVSFTAAQLPAGFTVCATCHSGRENGGTIDIAINAGGKNPAGTTIAPASDADYVLGFKNPHYLGAAGMMLGADAGMMFQYPTKAYSQKPAFWSLVANGPHGSPHGASCTKCHSPKGSKHTFEINFAETIVDGTWGGAYPVAGMQPGAKNTAACDGCHAGPYALEPKAEEFTTAAADLLTAIQAKFASNLTAIQTAVNGFTFGGGTTGQPALTLDGSTVTGICYDPNANPYWFFEVSGTCRSVGNATTTAVAAKLNPQLLKAAYNYQWSQKEPGAWAHNEYYVMQVMYDSIVDLGGVPSFKVAAVTDPTTHLPVAGDPLNRGY